MHTRRIASYLLVGVFWMLNFPCRINSQDPRCISYPDLPKNCKNILQCPTLLDILTRFGNFTGDYLQSTVCGWDGDDPLVCCADQLPPRKVPSNESYSSPESDAEPPWQPQFPQDCNYRRIRRFSDPQRYMHESTIVTHVEFRLRWRWMAMLGYKTQSSKIQWNCGGTLISSRHVLTAAHCIDGQPNLYLVRFGEYDLNSDIEDGLTHVDVLIERATIHPLYNKEKRTNDVGVLKLERDLDSSGHIRPICLPIHNGIRTMNLTGKRAYLAGWGKLDRSGALPTQLREIHIPILPLEQCREAFSKLPNYAENIDDRTICAGEPGGRMPCSGDSGGPLILMWKGVFYVVGVDSHGINICAEPGYPELFVKVSEYLDFILSQLN